MSQAARVQVSQRTLVLVGDQDLMLPSSEEGKRLPQIMRNCRTRELKGRSHALLQEAGVDLREIMEEEGFLVTSRRMSGTAAVGTRNANNFGGCGSSAAVICWPPRDSVK